VLALHVVQVTTMTRAHMEGMAAQLQEAPLKAIVVALVVARITEPLASPQEALILMLVMTGVLAHIGALVVQLIPSAQGVPLVLVLAMALAEAHMEAQTAAPTVAPALVALIITQGSALVMRLVLAQTPTPAVSLGVALGDTLMVILPVQLSMPLVVTYNPRALSLALGVEAVAMAGARMVTQIRTLAMATTGEQVEDLKLTPSTPRCASRSEPPIDLEMLATSATPP
jgi:hypothetical protein